jgi:hypothetical protein
MNDEARVAAIRRFAICRDVASALRAYSLRQLLLLEGSSRIKLQVTNAQRKS